MKIAFDVLLFLISLTLFVLDFVFKDALYASMNPWIAAFCIAIPVLLISTFSVFVSFHLLLNDFDNKDRYERLPEDSRSDLLILAQFVKGGLQKDFDTWISSNANMSLNN